MKIRAEVLVTGRVQQVAYRRHTLKNAQQIDITGWVRNRSDGSVAGCFEGQQGDVEALVAWCNSGSPRADVATVTVEWSPFRQEFAAFEILPDADGTPPEQHETTLPDGVLEISVRSTLDAALRLTG